MFFLDRADAGRKLAQALIAYKGQSAVVYGLPRGGVVLAVEVARILEAPLDLIVVRKIGHPHQPEYAIGAVAEDGYVVTNPDEVAALDKSWLEGSIAAELKEAQRRRKVFLQGRPSVEVKDKVALESPDDAGFLSDDPDLVLDKGLRVNGFSSPDNNLESVFKYLVVEA